MLATLIKFAWLILLSKDAFTFPMESTLFQRTMSCKFLSIFFINLLNLNFNNTAKSLSCNSRSFTKKIIMSNLNEDNGQDCHYAIRAYSLNVCQVLKFH